MVEFAIDGKLKGKIDLMIKRVMDSDENDNYLIFEGDTGSGKTNASVGVAHLVAKATGRTFDNSRVFFDTGKAVDFAKKTREQIIIFDEPAFGGLKAEWRKQTQINLIKLLFTARLKRHFVIFNIVKFSKFNDEIIEKAIALIRIYKRDESKKERRFLYIPHKNIPNLMDEWHRRHKRNYRKFAILRGTLFRYVLPEIIDKELYNEQKDKAIENIGVEEVKVKSNAKDQKLLKLQFELSQLPERLGLTKLEVAKALKVNDSTFAKWAKIGKKPEIFIDLDVETADGNAVIIDNGLATTISSDRLDLATTNQKEIAINV